MFRMAVAPNQPETGSRVPGRKKRHYGLLGLAAATLLAGGYFLLTLLIYPTVPPQQAIHLFQDAVTPTAGQKLLVLVPHPDDETIAAGGYIARSIQQGAEVRIVLVTDGNKHKNGAARYIEFRNATALLGVSESNLVFMGLPDGSLHVQDETTFSRLLRDQIGSFGPDTILYSYERDFHPDHAALGKEMNKIVGVSHPGRTVYKYLVHYEFFYPHPKKLALDLYLLPPARLIRVGNSWQKLMLSPPVEELKSQAIYCYLSQFGNPILKDLLVASIRKNELFIEP
jgi:N-acetylglucosamine malate deacetylase 1